MLEHGWRAPPLAIPASSWSGRAVADPRLVPASRRPDRLVALARMTHFSPYRTTPFIGLWFAEGEDGKLVIAPADACP